MVTAIVLALSIYLLFFPDFQRSDAVGACEAHNLEVVRSKLTFAINDFCFQSEPAEKLRLGAIIVGKVVQVKITQTRKNNCLAERNSAISSYIH